MWRRGAGRRGAAGCGLFGTRYNWATPRERAYLLGMARVAQQGEAATTDVVRSLGRAAHSLSATREGLIRKGLVFGPARGRLSFTVPEFAPYILRQSDD